MNIVSIFILFSMVNPSLEDMIGMHINDIPYTAVHNGSVTEVGGKIYSVSGFSNEFLSKPYVHMAIATDTNDTIINIGISFRESMDKAFYDMLVTKYGTPDSMYKRGVVKSREETVFDDNSTATSIKGTLKECEFEDRPLFVKWVMTNYQMEFTLLDEMNRTQLTIGKISQRIIPN